MPSNLKLSPLDVVLPHPTSRASSVRHRPKTIQILGCRIDRITRTDALEWARFFLNGGGQYQIITVNPLMILAAQQDDELAQCIDQAALVVPESSGIFWASQQVGTPLDEFVPGIDLFQRFCELARVMHRRFFLLGARPGVAEKAAVALCTRYPGLRVAGTHHGYWMSKEEETTVIAQIREAAPDFLFVGMNSPHQEKWIHKNLSALGVPIVMGVGGSFDVLSGRLFRAPAWVRELGLEWMFRTFQEPWRFQRIVHLPVFVWKVLFSGSSEQAR